jgi:uncharacterized Zn finger protein (UPF0148 family)
MSGFDEEAERERLREKYEQDQEKRAATQRMSELLLKGATMTNSHCDACGDPLFRHDGRTFCPTCQAAGGDAAGDPQAAGADDADVESTPDAGTTGASDSSATTDATRDDTDAPSATDRVPDPGADDSAPEPRTQSPRPAPSGIDSASAPLDDARASLSRTLVRYARAAEETDDPRRATERLAAAREAAEALAALDRR